MENATKALLMAAGVMLAIMILALLVMGYNQMSNYYSEKHDSIVVEQTTEFNKRFENYHREKIRGNDMISLMNRIIDYNATQVYQEGTNYKRISVTITIGDSSIRDQFKYKDQNGNIYGTDIINTETITNTSGTGIINDKKLIAITSTESDMKEKAKTKLGIDNITGSQLQSLSSNIANIIIDENATDAWSIRNRLKRKEIIKTILDINIDVSSDDAKTATLDSKNNIEVIKEIASQYYQYTQFKRAYFDCTEVIYDEDTGRVCEMNFKLRTNGGTVEFN